MRQHSDLLHSEYEQQPPYRYTATQMDEQRITHAEVQQHSGEKQEEDWDEYEEEAVDGAVVQATPMRARSADQHKDERTPYAHMHRTPLAPPLPAPEYDSEDISDSDDEVQQLDEDEEDEQLQEEDSEEGEAEEEGEDIDESDVGDGSPMEDERYDSEVDAEPLSQTSLSPQRSTCLLLRMARSGPQ